MRDSKTILLLSISFLLLVMSFVLLWTWWHGIRQVSIPAQDTARVITPAIRQQADTMPAHYLSLLRKMEDAFDTLQKQQHQTISPRQIFTPTISAIPSAKATLPVMNIPVQPGPAVEETHIAGMSASQLQLQASGSNTLTGSMMLRINNTSSDPEVVVVIRQPDGKVIQKNSWESGLIQTTEGRSIYSCKLRLDAAPGESKKMEVSLETPGLQPGLYTFSIYHEGLLIGKKVNRLVGS